MFTVPIFFLPEITNALSLKINAIQGGLTFYISLSVKLLLQLLFVNIKTKASDLFIFSIAGFVWYFAFLSVVANPPGILRVKLT